MAEITGLTAERMQEIIDATIDNGIIAEGYLILVRHDSIGINAGYVKGDTGDTGATGPEGPPGADGAGTGLLGFDEVTTGYEEAGAVATTICSASIVVSSVPRKVLITAHARVLQVTNGANPAQAYVDSTGIFSIGSHHLIYEPISENHLNMKSLSIVKELPVGTTTIRLRGLTSSGGLRFEPPTQLAVVDIGPA